MCFGGDKKDTAAADEAPRPVQHPNNGNSNLQAYNAPESKTASVPPQIQQHHQHHQPQQQQQQQQQQYPPQQHQPDYQQQQPVATHDYAPPAGSPPGHHHGQQQQQQQQQHGQHHNYAPPSGPPPSHTRPGAGADEFAPPSGPPPGHGRDEFAPPEGPPPSHLRLQGGEQYAPPSGPPPSHHGGGDFAPPSGPPPGHGGDFAPPSGPPPSHHGGGDFAPPSGPPPGHNGGDFAPPSGPPPGRGDPSWIAPPPGPPPSENKPKHDWESLVPDTSLFPPPPSFFSGFDRSPAHNATEVEAEAGEAWCHAHPLHRPINLDGPAVTALRQHNPRLMQPDGFRGSLVFTGPGRWTVKTESAARDSTIIAYPPLYAVTQQHNNPSPTTTIYYEIQLHPSPANPGVGDICIALGFTALPYPSFRMPGWHRGSLAVHGDDGHRFTNDRWGGKELTKPFRAGERLGLGMTFRRSHAQSYSGGNGRRAVEVEVFLTRQGREERRWDLHEETDNEQDLPVTGLEGEHDLSCAVGTSGKTGFDVLLDPRAWMFRPEGY